jgi:hypothetical protein
MDTHVADWRYWHEFFTKRKHRPLPQLPAAAQYRSLPVSLAKSLAIFQLGESGGGTVVEQARRSRLPGANADYAAAMGLFVAEEHRHAEILAMCVRLLGGNLIRKNWTASLFVAGRRLLGLRLKVIVLLAAEVVGICYYHLLASRLHEGDIKDWLDELVVDEQAHLHFHCEFLRSQTQARWRRWVFLCAWRSTMLAAAIVVMVDHRRALEDMGIDRLTVWGRWQSWSQKAERLVVDSCGATDRAFPLTE